MAMKNATEKTTISREDIFRAVAEIYRKSLEIGDGRWFFARVWPGGGITTGIEASPCYPESEYYHRKPHPVTIWESRSNSDLDDDQIQEEMDNLDDAWFDLNVGDLAEKLEPTGLVLAD